MDQGPAGDRYQFCSLQKHDPDRVLGLGVVRPKQNRVSVSVVVSVPHTRTLLRVSPVIGPGTTWSRFSLLIWS